MARSGRRPLLWLGAAALLAAALSYCLALRLHSPAAAADASVSVDPDSASVVVGSTVDVAVRIDDASNLYSAAFHLTFDPAVLEVVDADPSRDGVQIFPGTFPGPSQGPGDIVTNAADNTAGTVDYDFTLLDPAPVANGSGVLATIRFRGKAVGSSALTLSGATLWDPLNDPIPAGSSDGSVEVAEAAVDTPTAAAATPTPTRTPQATSTPKSTSTPKATSTPKPTSTPRPTSTPKPTATPRPDPPQQVVEILTPVGGVAAGGTHSTPGAPNLPSAGAGTMPSQLWRWFFLSGTIIMGLATWAFTFRFYARQKENERFWHR